MTKHDADKQDTQPTITPPSGRSIDTWGRQMVGAIIGAAVAFLLATGAQRLGWAGGDMVRYLLWGGVIGGLIGGSNTLAQAGKRLTHRDEDWLNVLVSLLGMVVIFGVLFAIALGLSSLLRQFLTER